MSLSFTIAVGPCQRSHSHVLSQIRYSPNLQGHAPVFIPPRNVVSLPGLELRPLGLPARSQSLYRLRYPGITEVLLVV
jgi:hypothetical protein